MQHFKEINKTKQNETKQNKTKPKTKQNKTKKETNKNKQTNKQTKTKNKQKQKQNKTKTKPNRILVIIPVTKYQNKILKLGFKVKAVPVLLKTQYSTLLSEIVVLLIEMILSLTTNLTQIQ